MNAAAIFYCHEGNVSEGGAAYPTNTCSQGYVVTTETGLLSTDLVIVCSGASMTEGASVDACGSGGGAAVWSTVSGLSTDSMLVLSSASFSVAGLYGLGSSSSSSSSAASSSSSSSVASLSSSDSSFSVVPYLSESDGYAIAYAIVGLWSLAYCFVLLKRAVGKS